MNTIKNKEVYQFKKGEKLSLDDIYMIQGLGDADWWIPIERTSGEEVIITKDIKIEIKITKKP